MLTIFSSPRPFKGEFDLIQRNAILSWISSCPNCEIILVGDDEGTAEAALEFGLKHIAKVKKNERGNLLRNSVFEEAQKAAKNDLVCFVSADIILTSDLLQAIKSINIPLFLLSGRRKDLEVKEKIDFTKPDWEEKIRLKIKNSKFHGFSAGDYFVFPRDTKVEMFPFSVKHGGWDNSFIFQFKKKKIPVIDATEKITVIHQNHDRPHLKNIKSIWKGEEGKKEIKLAGGFSNMCTLRDADLLLAREGLKKPPFLRKLISDLSMSNLGRLLLDFKRKLFS